MNEWLPIETAPKDGTRIIVVFPNGRVDFDRWEKKEEFSNGVLTHSREGFVGVWLSSVIGRAPDPTHWMPIPEGPAEYTK